MSESAVATALLVDFDKADPADTALLGGKEAGLAHMIGMGLDLPPGFTVTTHACREHMRTGAMPDGLWEEVAAAVGRLEQKVSRTFGGGPAPGSSPPASSPRRPDWS